MRVLSAMPSLAVTWQLWKCQRWHKEPTPAAANTRSHRLLSATTHRPLECASHSASHSAACPSHSAACPSRSAAIWKMYHDFKAFSRTVMCILLLFHGRNCTLTHANKPFHHGRRMQFCITKELVNRLNTAHCIPTNLSVHNTTFTGCHGEVFLKCWPSPLVPSATKPRPSVSMLRIASSHINSGCSFMCASTLSETPTTAGDVFTVTLWQYKIGCLVAIGPNNRTIDSWNSATACG